MTFTILEKQFHQLYVPHHNCLLNQPQQRKKNCQTHPVNLTLSTSKVAVNIPPIIVLGKASIFLFLILSTTAYASKFLLITTQVKFFENWALFSGFKTLLWFVPATYLKLNFYEHIP